MSVSCAWAGAGSPTEGTSAAVPGLVGDGSMSAHAQVRARGVCVCVCVSQSDG